MYFVNTVFTLVTGDILLCLNVVFLIVSPLRYDMARIAIESEFWKSKMADRSEIARNAIENEFRTSKMVAVSHFVKNFQKKLKLHIDLKWPEMQSKVNFGHPKWPMSAIVSKISKKHSSCVSI